MDTVKNIPAKISAPQLSGICHRERLLALFDNPANRQITWISGPAGAGKTTLAASYITARTIPHIWYRIDDSDTDIATFSYYLKLGLEMAFPQTNRSLPLFTPEYLTGIETFTKRYFEKLFAAVTLPFAIVLDDYQEVPADSMLHQVVHTGISMLPGKMRFIIVSRESPPPLFARLRTQHITTIGWNELRFTKDELRALMLQREHHAPNESTVERLWNKTGGWAAGMVLLTPFFKQGASDGQLPDALTPKEVFDYFSSEVFLQTDAQTREILLKIAVLPTMTGHMAEELTGTTTATQVLANLATAHCFVERTWDATARYSIHPLFRLFLMSQAKQQLPPEEYARLHHDAVDILSAAGQVDDAVRLLLSIQAYDRLALLLKDHGGSLIAKGRQQTMQRWLMSVPQKVIGNSAWLLYWQGICQFGFAPLASLPAFEKAFDLFQAQENLPGTLLAWSGAVNTLFAMFDDFTRMDPWIAWLDKQILDDTHFPSREIEFGVSTAMVIALIHRKPEHRDTRNWVQRAWNLSIEQIQTQSCLPTFPIFIYYYISMGEFTACATAVSDIRRLIPPDNGFPLLSLTLHLVEAMMSTVSAGQHRHGINEVSAALDLAERTGAHFLDPLLLGLGVQNAFNARDLAAASGFLAHMEKSIIPGSRGHTGYYCFLSAWHALNSRETDRALFLAERSVQLAEHLGIVFSSADSRILLAFVLIETAEYQEAKQQLTFLQQAATRVKSSFLNYRYHLLAAYWAFMQNDDRTGSAYLDLAMTIGRRKGFATMVNFWQPAALSYLCAKALDAGIEPEYVQHLIKSLKLPPPSSTITSDSWPWPVNVDTLGRFEIRRYHQPIAYSAKAPLKLLQLLKVLIACGLNGASTAHLADILWPDADGDSARKTLEITLFRLRKLLGNNSAIRLSEDRVSIAPDVCRIDAHHFEELVDHAESLFTTRYPQDTANVQDITEGLHLLKRAVLLYRGGFLGTSTETWALTYRERLKSKFIRAVTLLGKHLSAQQHNTDAVNCYRHGIAIDDGVESFYRGLMRCHLHEGHYSEAVAAYHLCVHSLRAHYGVSPSADTEALLNQIKTHSSYLDQADRPVHHR